MNTQQDRISKLLIDNKITAYRLSKETGVTQSTLSRFLNDPDGKVEMQPDTIYRIAKYFEVSPRWLLTGDNEAETPEYIATSHHHPAHTVPLLPIAAQGGSFNDFIVSVRENDCENVISPIKGADFAMPVSGDSMAPEYPNGSQILIKRINERAFIDWGKVYVLDTCNGSVIKRVFPADDKDPNKVKCMSINPEYPPFEVAFEDIYGMYRVLLCMSVK